MSDHTDDGFDQRRTKFVGPLEVGTWPPTLCARVVTPGAQPCIHGYDVESDLAGQRRFADLILLTLTGELPSEECALAFDVALAYLLPLSVAYAPTHATILARLSGASTSSMLGVAAVSLGEQARFTVDEHAELLQALNRSTSNLPAAAFSGDLEETASVERLEQTLCGLGVRIPRLQGGLSRMAALLVVLHYCGLTEREQLIAAIVQARFPAVLAEALSERVTNFRHYPINLPQFSYEETP